MAEVKLLRYQRRQYGERLAVNVVERRGQKQYPDDPPSNPEADDHLAHAAGRCSMISSEIEFQ